MLSSPRPTNTDTTPIHCLATRALPNSSTEASIVKNFRVVVIIEHVNGPKFATVMKIKFCKTKRVECQRQANACVTCF